MAEFHGNIIQLTKENAFFRKVLYTGAYSQLVLMSIPERNDIGSEIHPETDQILYFVEGKGEAIMDKTVIPIEAGDAVFIPAGVEHNFRNTGSGDLKLYTTYSPSHHPDGTIHPTKLDAEANGY